MGCHQWHRKSKSRVYPGLAPYRGVPPGTPFLAPPALPCVMPFSLSLVSSGPPMLMSIGSANRGPGVDAAYLARLQLDGTG